MLSGLARAAGINEENKDVLTVFSRVHLSRNPVFNKSPHLSIRARLGVLHLL